MIKSISGIYLDNQGFTHLVWYNGSKKKYVKTISNQQMKYCSSAEYTKPQIIDQISGMTKGFEYLGLTFYSYLKLRGSEGKFLEMSKHINDKNLTPEGWNYEEFYNASYTKMYDLYLCNGIIVIPASKYLFEYVF